MFVQILSFLACIIFGFLICACVDAVVYYNFWSTENSQFLLPILGLFTFFGGAITGGLIFVFVAKIFHFPRATTEQKNKSYETFDYVMRIKNNAWCFILFGPLFIFFNWKKRKNFLLLCWVILFSASLYYDNANPQPDVLTGNKFLDCYFVGGNEMTYIIYALSQFFPNVRSEEKALIQESKIYLGGVINFYIDRFKNFLFLGPILAIWISIKSEKNAFYPIMWFIYLAIFPLIVTFSTSFTLELKLETIVASILVANLALSITYVLFKLTPSGLCSVKREITEN